MKWIEKKKGISWCCFSKELFSWMVDFWICGNGGGGRVGGGDSGSGSNCGGSGSSGGDSVKESVAVVAAVVVVDADSCNCCLL